MVNRNGWYDNGVDLTFDEGLAEKTIVTFTVRDTFSETKATIDGDAFHSDGTLIDSMS